MLDCMKLIIIHIALGITSFLVYFELNLTKNEPARPTDNHYKSADLVVGYHLQLYALLLDPGLYDFRGHLRLQRSSVVSKPYGPQKPEGLHFACSCLGSAVCTNT